MKFATGFSLALALFLCPDGQADIIVTGNATYLQNLNALASTPDDGIALSPTDSLYGWTFQEANNSVDTMYGFGNGSNAAGITYSFGSTGSTERAFGTMGQKSSPLPPCSVPRIARIGTGK